MSRLIRRAFADDGDLRRLVSALSESHRNADGSHLWHPGDLVWALFQNEVVDPREVVHLWERTDGSLAGFAVLEDEDINVQVLTSDPHERAALTAEALDLACDQRAEVRTEVLKSDDSWRRAVTARGFVPDVTRRTRRGEPYTGIVCLAQSLDGPDASVAASDGLGSLTVREVGDESEWPARVELHRTVWAPSQVTLTAYRRLRSAPVYRPDLDLVAVDTSGAMAAYCIVWFDPHSRVGEFEPVGTHPDHRRRGAGAAVLREGLNRLRRLGARRALVISSADNPASLRLYESVGFQIVDAATFYHRPSRLTEVTPSRPSRSPS